MSSDRGPHPAGLPPALRRPSRRGARILVVGVGLSVWVHLLLVGLARLIPMPPPSEAPVELEMVTIPPTPQPAEKAARKQDQRQQLPKVAVPELTALAHTKPAPAIAQPAPQPKAQTEPPKPEVNPADKQLAMVELDTPSADEEPEDARYLSDKNRRVEHETRARETSLQLALAAPEHREATGPVPPDRLPTVEPGRRESAAEDREHPAAAAGPKAPQRASPNPLLSMRGEAHDDQPLPELEDGGDVYLPRPGNGRTSAPGHARLGLDHRDFDRIYGDGAERARREARVGGFETGHARRTAQQWQRVRAALENFIPEVQPGNQTALNTRASPFAVYIARMHRHIHQLWGFGFLVDLDRKADSNPLNDMSLWTMIELSISPAGGVVKATVVRPSGLLAFDTAALHTVFAAAPYPPTPPAIRSADGNVYMHWRFHRDQRECGTFGVDPYILTKPGQQPGRPDRMGQLRSQPPQEAVACR